jgi:hypothetical protein
MADHSKPTNTSFYTDYTSEIDSRFDDITIGLDPALTTATNVPTGAIRWTSASFKWQKWSGSAWADLSSSYSININGTLGATTPSTVAATTISASGVSTFSAGSAGAPAITTTGDTNTGIFFPAADTIAFAEGGVEAMRIDSSGNVGIGTASPTTRLFVTANSGVSNYDGGQTAQFSTGGSTNNPNGRGHVAAFVAGGVGDSASTYGASITLGASSVGSIAIQHKNGAPFAVADFYPGGTYVGSGNPPTERMRIDTSGNLGLGVTPSAWGSGYKAIQSTNGASFGDMNGYTSVASNYFNNGSGDKYIANGYASRYLQSGIDGIHRWYTAASGTAGNAITFTQAMTLDNSGNLSVGRTAPYYSSQKINAYSASANDVRLCAFSEVGGATAGVDLMTADGNSSIKSINNALIFSTAGRDAERMRIDASGNLLVGTTTSPTVSSGKALVVAGPITSNGLNTSSVLANGASENIIVFGSDRQGNYLFTGRQAGLVNGGIYALALVAVGSSASNVISILAAGLTFSNGTVTRSVQITNSAGGSSSFQWSYTQIM